MVRLSRHKTWFNPPAALIGSCPFPGGNPNLKPTFFILLFVLVVFCYYVLYMFVDVTCLSDCLYICSMCTQFWQKCCLEMLGGIMHLVHCLSELACGYLRWWFTGDCFWGQQIPCSLGLTISFSFQKACLQKPLESERFLLLAYNLHRKMHS